MYCQSASVEWRDYFAAGAATGALAFTAGSVLAGAATAGVLASTFGAAAAAGVFLAMPAILRQYGLSGLPVLASIFFGTIQPHTSAFALQATSSRPLHGEGAAAVVVAAFGATGVLTSAFTAGFTSTFGATLAGAAVAGAVAAGC